MRRWALRWGAGTDAGASSSRQVLRLAGSSCLQPLGQGGLHKAGKVWERSCGGLAAGMPAHLSPCLSQCTFESPPMPCASRCVLTAALAALGPAPPPPHPPVLPPPVPPLPGGPGHLWHPRARARAGFLRLPQGLRLPRHKGLLGGAGGAATPRVLCAQSGSCASRARCARSSAAECALVSPLLPAPDQPLAPRPRRSRSSWGCTRRRHSGAALAARGRPARRAARRAGAPATASSCRCPTASLR